MTPQAKVEEIALYLGKPWKYSRLGEPSQWRFEIIDGCGRGLYFRLEKDRFKIGGMFPRQKCRAWHEDYKDIGVSAARSAKDIAADIKRRLIPHYLKAYESALLRYNEEQEKEAHLNLIAQSLVSVSQGRISDHSRARKTIYFDQGTAEIWSSGDINLELNRLSIEQVIQIVAMLKA
tara:strand:- start:639 stop:1169 length:531 start_codon:yes stop_codon:yes gene_type:complete